ASRARADVQTRTYTALGDVTYFPTEGEPSCGKEPREHIKAAVKATRTVTVTSTHVRVNSGEPMKIVETTRGAVIAMTSYSSPTATHPNRIVTMAMAVVANGDDATFFLMRSATANGSSCTDMYRVSIE